MDNLQLERHYEAVIGHIAASTDYEVDHELVRLLDLLEKQYTALRIRNGTQNTE